MGRYTSEQRVFLYDTYVKCGSARKSRRKFLRKFCHARVPNRQTIHNLVSKLEDVEFRREHKTKTFLKCLARETGVSKLSARMAPKLLKLRPCKSTAIRAARSS
ncbi:hypothetical protein B7P43_G08415 [Cryptotermes secundus]|uniref:DUF4817 domain-containing protein n=1 Tax=Cryptotermes secundus TaxID=105785 RepID=A0A2J7R602_9NEOP|nr:hypothetical protein B7P43_G08415 [Cryptotermes secundus]